MSFLDSVQNVLGFFGLHHVADESRHVRRTLLSEQPSYSRRSLAWARTEHAEPTAEVDNLKERFSAKRYVQHMRDAMEASARGELAKGRPEWLNYLNSMRPDDYRHFLREVDELIDGGELVEVLTPEQELEKRQGVLDKWEQYNAAQLGLMHDMGVDPALANKMLATTLAGEDLDTLNAIPEGAEAAAEEAREAMDDAEVEVWAEDESDGMPEPSSDTVNEYMNWLAKQRKESAERLEAEQAAWPLTPEEAANPLELISRWEESASSEDVALTVTEDEFGSASIVWHKPKEGETHEEEEQDEDEKHEVGQER